MNNFSARTLSAVMVSFVVANAAGAWAAPKKGKPPPASGPTADDFLGGLKTAPKPAQDDLKNAAGGVQKKQETDELAPRVEVQARDNAVHMRSVFLSSKIMITSAGCVGPSTAGGTAPAIKSINASDLPFIVHPFSVCARLESGRGRAVPVVFRIVTPKGRLVAQSEELVDFGGRQQVDVVVDFPELKFPVEGVYKYRLEVEAVTVTEMDLLDVKFVGARRPDAEEAGP